MPDLLAPIHRNAIPQELSDGQFLGLEVIQDRGPDAGCQESQWNAHAPGDRTKTLARRGMGERLEENAGPAGGYPFPAGRGCQIVPLSDFADGESWPKAGIRIPARTSAAATPESQPSVKALRHPGLGLAE